MERILLVEDNAAIRSMLQEALEDAGFDVLAVPEGGAALEAQDRAPADVVVTDLYMPGMEGLETITALRRRYPRTKIVAISGGSRLRAADANPAAHLGVAREIGADAVLKKPFNPDELIAVVRQVLD